MNPTIDIALALIHREGRLLVARRSRGPLAGLWEFPGGKIEPGESLEIAVRRECTEELGVEVEPDERLEAVEHRYPEVTVRLHPVLCRLVGDAAPRPLDSSALAWADPRELPRWGIPIPNQAILDQFERRAL